MIKGIDFYKDNNKKELNHTICVLGADGQLGADFVSYFKNNEFKNFVGFDKTLDISNKTNIELLKCVPCDQYGTMRRPDIIINCAAYNDVYGADSNKNECFKSNALGPKYLAEFCRRENIKLVHYSTNYVFEDGRYTMKKYSEFDCTKPYLFYGFSKLCGENFIREYLPYNSLILRTSWLYNKNGKIVKALTNKSNIFNVSSAFGCPTYTLDLIKQTMLLIDNNYCGLCHCVSKGAITKKKYIQTIAKNLNLNIKIEESRPSVSIVLENFMLDMEGLNIMRSFEDAVADCFRGI